VSHRERIILTCTSVGWSMATLALVYADEFWPALGCLVMALACAGVLLWDGLRAG
jgi:hypothetical protein